MNRNKLSKILEMSYRYTKNFSYIIPNIICILIFLYNFLKKKTLQIQLFPWVFYFYFFFFIIIALIKISLVKKYFSCDNRSAF